MSSYDDKLCGYVISHPIRRRCPPPLDTLLGEIPEDADQYYIHDLAVLPGYRGCGFAQHCVDRLLGTVAKDFETTGLVSVYGSEAFWGQFGFSPLEEKDGVLEKKVLHYSDDAVFLERKNGDGR